MLDKEVYNSLAEITDHLPEIISYGELYYLKYGKKDNLDRCSYTLMPVYKNMDDIICNR